MKKSVTRCSVTLCSTNKVLW